MNLSTLQRNMVETMSDDASTLYLRGCERDEWKACQMAWEWDQISPVLNLATRFAEKPFPGSTPKVLEFVKERHYRRFFPDGRK